MSLARTLACFAVAFALASASAIGDPPSPPTVVLELFTSQGCSSCPPADRLLSRLGREGLDGVRVVPLAFHVDYWNYIGWTDPFSTAEWSLRQRRYADRLRSDTVYTPQLVVDGASECVGSDERRARRLIAEAAARSRHGGIRLDWRHRRDGSIGAAVEAWITREPPRPLLAVVALYESGLETAVARGENARRTLQNDFVVRRLARLFELPKRPGERRRAEVSFEPESGWDAASLGVVAFLQDPETLAIDAASR